MQYVDKEKMKITKDGEAYKTKSANEVFDEIQKLRIELDPNKDLKEQIVDKAREAISRVMGKKSGPITLESITAESVAFDYKNDSHIFELFMYEIHKELVRIDEEDLDEVDQSAIMFTDPIFSQVVIDFRNEMVTGELVSTHELRHAQASEDLNPTSNYIVFTPFRYDG
jgi:hypothetical protein